MYSTNPEGTAEKCSFTKTRVPLSQEARDSFPKFKELLINFMGIREKIRELAFGNFDMRMTRLQLEGHEKNNFEIFTQQQYEIEMKTLLEDVKNNEINGKGSTINDLGLGVG